MDPARWSRIEEVFHGALDRAPDLRGPYLDEACAGDAELRRAVEALLAQHAADPDFLEEPLARVAELPGADGASGGERFIGPYRLVRRLGRGGMGEVWLAMQESEGLSRAVALKVVQPGLDTEVILRRFRLERRILAGLKHPNIAQLLDAGVAEDGRPYFVMEHVEGVPLLEHCDRERLDVEARIRLFRDVCAAVQHAHQNLVLHRDLKPANILVEEGGTPKLLDFGIAKLLTPEAETQPATRTEARMLTPEYAAPEQLRGGHVSAATDVYGLGVLLYELLTGRRPHVVEDEGAGWIELERAITTVEPPRPSTAVTGDAPDERAAQRGTDPRRLGRRLAGDLDTIVLKALRKEPERRYTSVAALSDDLGRHLEGRPVLARPDTLAYRAGKFARRNALPLGAAALVGLSLLGATVVSVAQSRRVAAERDRALEVRSFLLEMFGASGPDQETGDAVTARQLLDRQAEALDEAYRDEPVLRAEMTMVLAEGYDRLGIYPEAERLAARALELRRETLGSGHVDVARALALLGWVRHEAGASAEGEALLREAIEIFRADGGDPQGLARALNDLGVVRDAAGDADGAEPLYVEALELRRRELGEGHRSVAITASNLSVIRYRRGDFAGAVEAATEALEAMQAALGADHQRSIVIQGNLAAFWTAQGDYAAAEAQYRDLLDRQSRLQGAEHPVTLRVAGSLGTVLANQAKWAEAEAVFRRTAEAQARTLGEGHPQVSLTRVRLAGALAGLDRNTEALALLEPARRVLVDAVGPEHPAVVEALEAEADARAPAEPERAEALYRQALGILERRNGPDHPATALSLLRLAEWLGREGRDEEALPLLRRAHEALVEAHPPGHLMVHRSRVALAEAAFASGRVAEADSLLAAARSAFVEGGVTERTRVRYDALRTRVDRSLEGGR